MLSVYYVMQDVLENEEIKLDGVFKFSLIQDLVRVGLLYFNFKEERRGGVLALKNWLGAQQCTETLNLSSAKNGVAPLRVFISTST